MKRRHDMPFGARLLPRGEAEFRLWAPTAKQVELVLNGRPQPLAAAPDGWYAGTTAALAGDRYAFRIDGHLVVPDPASRSNPDDVHGASQLVDPEAFDWPDGGWRGRPWHEAVVYELHVGCFTKDGTFAAAIDRLDDLVALGITAIELMPVADFPGDRGWGYDGVLHFAPDASYGSPDELKRLVAAAHARGLMVLLDVVYNHFGPDGNYLYAYAQTFFDRTVQTPWGAAINFAGAGSRTVRDFFIHNALYWIEEFHLDGLRVDAVHAMRDDSSPHFVDELAHAVRNGPGQERPVHLVLENDVNDAARLARDTDGSPLLSVAQWNDDVHHALHVMVSGEQDGYYADFATDPLRLFGRALAEGFAFQGDPSAYRAGERRGTPSTALPPLAFVNSMQTHDQIGNRAFGDRIAALAGAAGQSERLRALVACVLLAPPPPMLFMGEEFAASTPFLYFCDFSGDLAQAVTDGRRTEFGRFALFTDPTLRATIPDPNALTTFQRSKLDWSERDANGHAQWLALYRRLLALRRQWLQPLLPLARSGRYALPLPDVLQVAWPLGAAGTWRLRVNLSSAPAGGLAALPGETVYASADTGAAQAPNSVRVTLERP
ncbi:MAG: malto-oligosyltrehalose trehalohydrolase [Burkholderiaceae bacterium]